MLVKHIMLFGKSSNHKTLKIVVNDRELETVDKTMFLGMILDSKLSFNEHISRLFNKISKSTGIIKRVKWKLCKSTLTHSYYAFVHSYLTYCNTTWGNFAKV